MNQTMVSQGFASHAGHRVTFRVFVETTTACA
jgi:hypothetical protein